MLILWSKCMVKVQFYSCQRPAAQLLLTSMCFAAWHVAGSLWRFVQSARRDTREVAFHAFRSALVKVVAMIGSQLGGPVV